MARARRTTPTSGLGSCTSSGWDSIEEEALRVRGGDGGGGGGGGGSCGFGVAMAAGSCGFGVAMAAGMRGIVVAQGIERGVDRGSVDPGNVDPGSVDPGGVDPEADGRRPVLRERGDRGDRGIDGNRRDRRDRGGQEIDAGWAQRSTIPDRGGWRSRRAEHEAQRSKVEASGVRRSTICAQRVHGPVWSVAENRRGLGLAIKDQRLARLRAGFEPSRPVGRASSRPGLGWDPAFS